MTTALPSPDISKLRIAALSDPSVFEDFDCGKREVNGGIQQCCEWHGINRVRVYCAHFGDVPQAYGFYSASILAPDPKHIAGADVARASEGRNYVPFIYLNYLGVRKEFQRRQIGAFLLSHFLTRCEYIVHCVGIFGVALHALTPDAVDLYSKYGFGCRDNRRSPLMILPTETILDLAKVRNAANTLSTPAIPDGS